MGHFRLRHSVLGVGLGFQGLQPGGAGRQLPCCALPCEGFWHDAMVCCSRLQLAAPTGQLPFAAFPWTLSLRRRWCPSASHHPVTFLFLLALAFPLYFPSLSLGLSLHRPWCPSASHHSFPSFPLVGCANGADLPCFTSLCRVHTEEGTCLRRWPGVSKRPSQAGGEVPLPNSGCWALGCPLAVSFPRRGHITTSCLQIPALSPPFGERITPCRGVGLGGVQALCAVHGALCRVSSSNNHTLVRW